MGKWFKTKDEYKYNDSNLFYTIYTNLEKDCIIKEITFINKGNNFSSALIKFKNPYTDLRKAILNETSRAFQKSFIEVGLMGGCDDLAFDTNIKCEPNNLDDYVKLLTIINKTDPIDTDDTIRDICEELGITHLWFPTEKIDTLIKEMERDNNCISTVISTTETLLNDYPDALLRIADWLVENQFFPEAYEALNKIPSTNKHYKEANEKCVEIIRYQLDALNDDNENTASKEEINQYQRQIFKHSLLSGKETLYSQRLFQHDILHLPHVDLQVGSLKGDPESFLELADAVGKIIAEKDEKIKQLEAENATLREQLATQSEAHDESTNENESSSVTSNRMGILR